LTPNPILKVLSTLTWHHVEHLLMGGQACVLYGAAEFSRDTDVAILADIENLARLDSALADLQAHCIAVPPFRLDYLLRGHAVRFRAEHPEARGMRIDVMAVMRGVAPFEQLWSRRTTLKIESGEQIELISLPDLVQAKKTQRDKDWSMLRRLIEANHAAHQEAPTVQHIEFWLRESRTATMLVALAREHPDTAASLVVARSLLALASSGDISALEAALLEEAVRERDADRAYWLPLRRELEELRQTRPK
jgi:hypothetical protein